jgi:hypothetical protein
MMAVMSWPVSPSNITRGLSVTQLYDFKGLVKWPPTQLEWILQLGNPELWSFMANYNEEFKDFHDFWTEASILTGVVETDSILRWIKFNPAKRVAPILRVLLSFDNTASLKEIVPYAIGLNISGNVGPEYFLAAVLEKSGSLDSLVKEKVVDYKGSRQQKRHPKTGILKYTCSTNHVAYVHVHWFDSDSPKVLTSAHVKIHETDARGCELNETKNRAFFPNLLKRVCQILELTLPKE